ncbi:MAG: CotH kinase family protein, partial [Planctomycetota bacterium]
MIKPMRISLLILILSVSVVCFAEQGDQAYIPLAINELMVSNSNVIRDPQGQYDDWIEIHNYGLEAIDIGGMYLTDNLSDATKWRISADNSAITTIPAGGYLLIWADNDTSDSGLHANFKLSADGEEIGLFDTDGFALIDSIDFAEQTTDISYGRFPDAGDYWQNFETPSPGAQNISEYFGEVAEVEFSHVRGFYETPFYVTIATETEGAAIYYTLDGSEPFALDSSGRSPNGIVYTGPVLINKITCLRAKAVKPDFRPGEINTQTFIFLDDVLQQPHSPSGFPTSWRGITADYQMDPDIVQDSRYNGMMKNALLSIPTMSIVMKTDDMFGSGNGIYSNPTNRGVSWERPCSVELIYPDGEQGFQINCGIRIQGGWFRALDRARKKSFRLFFKGIYGSTKLRYPLFGEGAVDEFDTITLRGGANDGYTWNAARYTEQYTRDEFGRSLQVATGNAGSHGMFIHLYINGLYWGLYNPCERPDHSHSASYYGGEKENWDAIHSGHERFEVINGDSSTWNQMLSMCRQARNSNEEYQRLGGNNPDGTPNPVYPNLLDVTNYIDYIIVNVWGGNWDWPWKNWYAARDRSVDSTGFKFYCWDYENTMGNNLGRSPLNKNALHNNFSSAGEPHQSLQRNAEYSMLFADRVHRFFFNNGILTPQSLIERYTAMANEIELSIATESARWGDQHHSNPLTLEDWYDRDTNYNDGRAGRDWILRYYLPQRSDVVLQQFRNAGLYPNVDAPVFSINGTYRHGGQMSHDDTLSMTAPSGTIWYTLDGSDPRSPDTTTGQQTSILVPENADKRVLVPVGDIGEDWKGGDTFNDSAWLPCIGGPGGVGFERTTGYQDFFTLDL